MKKTYKILMFALASLIVIGCALNHGQPAHDFSDTVTVNDVLNDGKETWDTSIASDAGSQEENNINANNDSLIESQHIDNSDNADVIENADAIENAEDEINVENDNNDNDAQTIDMDLTILSSVIVYSQVFDMMVNPDIYVGKTIKIEGIYVPYYDEINDKRYHACIVQDATACCSQGIEFEPSDDYVYPDDFPKEGEIVTVIGTFETYKENDVMYCTLRNASMIK